jgi:hypothetical protein
MKLIRWIKGDGIYPGIVSDHQYYDVSDFGEDYNESFLRVVV